MNSLHFISGLPRSGSTLLAAILKQNPRFVAGMKSPVSTLFQAIEDATSRKHETSVFVTEHQRDNLLRGLFETYHQAEKNNVIFDTSRMWCARTAILSKLFPKSKFICCVRELGWIMDSFERIYRRNDQRPSAIYNYDLNSTVYSRTVSLAGSNGVVGYALDALREAIATIPENIMLIDYEMLCKNPEKTIKGLYEFIGEEKFNHDFKNVQYHAGEFDEQLGAPGLHDVSGEVIWRQLKTILPLDLFMRFRNDSFWREGKWASKITTS